MKSPVLSRFATPALVLALASLLIPAAVDAKVSCDTGAVPGGPVELPGLPAEPEAGRLYELTVDLPEVHAVNPRPLLLAVRCEPLDGVPEGDELDGSASAQFRGTVAGGAGTEFDVRFRRSGRWRLASMDVSGRFRDHGFYAVRPASIAATENDATTLIPALLSAGAVAGLAGLAIAVRRRRHLPVAPDPRSGT